MDIEEPLFQPFPSDIVFQNFNPFETYQVPLQLRNNDKVNSVTFVCDRFFPFHFTSDKFYVPLEYVSWSESCTLCIHVSHACIIYKSSRLKQML